MSKSKETGPIGPQPVERHPNFDVRMSYLTQKRASKEIVDTFLANGGGIGGDPRLAKLLKPVLKAETLDVTGRRNGSFGS